jgi:hypothetical protein
MEEGDEGEMLIINTVKSGDEGLSKCIMDKENFQAQRERKQCKRTRKIYSKPQLNPDPCNCIN